MSLGSGRGSEVGGCQWGGWTRWQFPYIKAQDVMDGPVSAAGTLASRVRSYSSTPLSCLSLLLEEAVVDSAGNTIEPFNIVSPLGGEYRYLPVAPLAELPRAVGGQEEEEEEVLTGEIRQESPWSVMLADDVVMGCGRREGEEAALEGGDVHWRGGIGSEQEQVI
ncbi:hypothetical protein O3P69_004289 [Scylla paramamosain]|uniref:Uncharacterized protein n=1 Tax=Scylla paramamosain TaxID=85552 RepID=A0AAW0UH33_SCYPA